MKICKKIHMFSREFWKGWKKKKEDVTEERSKTRFVKWKADDDESMKSVGNIWMKKSYILSKLYIKYVCRSQRNKNLTQKT